MRQLISLLLYISTIPLAWIFGYLWFEYVNEPSSFFMMLFVGAVIAIIAKTIEKKGN